MAKKIRSNVGSYKPCKITECYQDLDEVIEISSYTGVIKLRGLGRLIWILCNGENTIDGMVDKLVEEKQLEDRQAVFEQVVGFVENLRGRQVVESNWDPLYKYDLEQELYYEE